MLTASSPSPPTPSESPWWLDDNMLREGAYCRVVGINYIPLTKRLPPLLLYFVLVWESVYAYTYIHEVVKERKGLCAVFSLK
jgi:hypothetical protein